jgi:hypothetical protein
LDDYRPRFRSPRAAARDAARRTLRAHGDPWRFGSAPGHTLLLVTTGARSGLRRETPLFFVRDGQRLVLIASKGGADSPVELLARALEQ